MQLQLDNNKKELKSHGTYAFPVNVSYEQLSRYERKSFLWHWHKEIELTILLQGEMQYQVNDTIYHLQAGEGLFWLATVCNWFHDYKLLMAIYPISWVLTGTMVLVAYFRTRKKLFL